MRTRFRIKLGVGALAAVMVMAGCGSPQANVQPGDDSLKSSIPLDENFDPQADFAWSFSRFSTSMDPVTSISGFDVGFLFPIYDRLVRSAVDGTIEPMLAESWEESPDGKSLTFSLRPNLKFTDGEPFNAQAAKVNLDRAIGPDSKIKNLLAAVTSVEVVDELTVQINVDGALGRTLAALTERPGMMASPKAIAAGTLETEPVGIGPYVATEILPGESVTLVKTDGYWDQDAQRVTTMHLKGIADDQTRFNALQSGELDGAYLRQNQVQASLDGGLDVISDVSPQLLFMSVNGSIPPFDNPKVRLAMNYAIDREGIGNGLMEGFCTPQIQPFPKTSFAYNKKIGDGLQIWPHDPEKAKKLLNDAGYPDGFAFETVTTNISGYVAVSEAVQDQLKEVGISMAVKPLTTAALVDEFAIAKTAAGIIVPSSATTDPHFFMAESLLPGGRYNPGGQLSQSMIDLIGQGSEPLDPADRAPYYTKAMTEWVESPPHSYPICMMHIVQAFADDVSGVSIYQTGMLDLRGVAVSKKK